ncbi:hypothetical protein [Methylosinus sporium]|uniref:hypothetical protein n=1 Tax=Methylosinus sporium TaxID=428 RepID=UPI00383A20D9
MRFLFILGAIALAVVLFVAVVGFWKLDHPIATIRYRLTLLAEVEGRLMSGASVVEVDYYDGSLNPDRPPDLPPVGAYASGEAVVVDMGARGVLFATLTDAEGRPRIQRGANDASADHIVTYAFAQPPIRQKEDLGRLRAITGRIALPLTKLPLLVRFRDLADPRTVERVDPENLAASFGPGVRLVGATIEITNDPLTNKIEATLPWLRIKDAGDRSQRLKSEAPQGDATVNFLHYSDLKRNSK